MPRSNASRDFGAVASERQIGERAMAILAQAPCEYTGLPIDFTVGHCGDANRVGETHTHCPFCGSGDECPHLLAQFCDDGGYSGPDIPLVPYDWSVPNDWTAEQLQAVVGDLRPAFEAYAGLPHYYEDYVRFEVFRELGCLLDSDVRGIRWCGDGMAAGIGAVIYAADADSATAELGTLSNRLQTAILRLESLRTTGPNSGAEVSP
jgi:hypothetical protein